MSHQYAIFNIMLISLVYMGNANVLSPDVPMITLPASLTAE